MVEHWVVNALVFSLPFSWLMSYTMYKDLKRAQKINELQRKENDLLIEKITPAAAK